MADISTILATGGTSLLVGLVAGYFLLRSKHHEYAYDYYKKIISCRFDTYQQIEEIIRLTRMTLLGDDKRAYHILFAVDIEESPERHPTPIIASAILNSQWLGPTVFKLLQDLNYILYSAPTEREALIRFGQDRYSEIANIREQLEAAVASDLARLHDVPAFLKEKAERSKTRGFRNVVVTDTGLKVQHSTSANPPPFSGAARHSRQVPPVT